MIYNANNFVFKKNSIYNGKSEDLLKLFPDECVDLTITSPPYGELRDYDGNIFDLPTIIIELYRITKKGGVVVWVVNDETKNGSESLESFRQALLFKDMGWNVHDTMIYKKINPPPNAGKRYQQCFEYMFVFSKGTPKTTNIQLRKRINNSGDKRTYRKKTFLRKKDGEFQEKNDYYIKEYVPKENIFEYKVGGGHSTKDKIAYKHPAIFPEKLADDHIISWSNKNDTVLDIFCGSGTTLKMAKLNNRNYIGIDNSIEYCKISLDRINLPKSIF